MVTFCDTVLQEDDLARLEIRVNRNTEHGYNATVCFKVGVVPVATFTFKSEVQLSAFALTVRKTLQANNLENVGI